MKKTAKLLFAVILLFIVWIGIDRYMNITPYFSDGSTTMVEVNDGVWTNIPNEKWIQLDNKVFKPIYSALYVEQYNPILRTWNNVRGADYTYTFKNEHGQPLTLQVFERDIDFNHEFELNQEEPQIEVVNDITVEYGKYNDHSYVIKYVNSECEIIIMTGETYLDFLKPTLQDILNQLQK